MAIKIRIPRLTQAAFYITGQGSPASISTLTLRLYTAPSTQPDPTANAAQFTAPTDAGYAPQTVSPGDWSGGGTGDDFSRYSGGSYTFNFSGGTGETVQGYYLLAADGDWVWGDLLPGGPFPIPSGGGTLGLVLKFEARDAVFV